MNSLMDAFGENFFDSNDVLTPPHGSIYRIKRTKLNSNFAGYFDSPANAILQSKLLDYGDYKELLSENGKTDARSQREGYAAVAAALVGAVKKPVRRGDGAGVDFYDADGIPFDVKTPKTGYKMSDAAESIKHELEVIQRGDDGNGYLSRVVVDTTFLSDADHATLWALLSDYKSEERLIEVSLPYGDFFVYK